MEKIKSVEEAKKKQMNRGGGKVIFVVSAKFETPMHAPSQRLGSGV
jgi:hypothetical protein